MKKTILTVLCAVAASAGLAGAVEKIPAAADKPAAEEAWKGRTFTAEELKKYNGKDGLPVYAAVDGVVYDLSRSKYWESGQHMMMHDAGADLSSELHNKAPKGIHKGGKILEGMPKVGMLVKTAPAAAETPASAGKPAAGGVALHKITKEELGREERCPVTRKTLKVAEGTPAVDYKGKTYYFSSTPLVEQFTKNPEKYLGGIKDKAKGLFKKKS